MKFAMLKRHTFHLRWPTMCSVVFVPGHEPLKTVADLRAVGLRLPGDSYTETRWPELACLCGVDINEVMDFNGLSWFEDRDTGNLVVFPLGGEASQE